MSIVKVGESKILDRETLEISVVTVRLDGADVKVVFEGKPSKKDIVASLKIIKKGRSFDSIKIKRKRLEIYDIRTPTHEEYVNHFWEGR